MRPVRRQFAMGGAASIAGRVPAVRQVLAAAAAAVPPATGTAADPAAGRRPRVRPGDPDWPAETDWQRLADAVGGALVPIDDPFAACRRAAATGAAARPAAGSAADPAAACEALFDAIRNPYLLRDQVGLTQTFGWAGAWRTTPSVRAVVARTAADVAAAVDFARRHRLRLVVKGGGHGYQGTSCAPDSLLVWTRRLDAVTLHDGFVPRGRDGIDAPVRAVSVGAGAVWGPVYDAVTTRGGGYVQGGGCMTVGVAGLVQSGGFGNFSKGFGLAAGSLLEAEVVTADGAIRVVNAGAEPDLFWALKGGGGGSFGIVTRLTLRVHPLPDSIGALNATIRARSDAAWRRLVGLVLEQCRTRLLTPHWGEQIRFRRDRTLILSLLFQGLTRAEAQAAWAPFFDAVDAAGSDLAVDFAPLRIVMLSARDFWAATWAKRLIGVIRRDGRPGAPPGHVYWSGDGEQAGQCLLAYGSAWLPATLLADDRRDALADALVAASRRWGVSLHLNKGLAGAPETARAAARDTAIHPAAVDAFALAISGAEQHGVVPGLAGREPDPGRAAAARDGVGAAIAALRALVPEPGAYVAESDYFEADWARAFWGPNYPRLRAVKARYDPDGLFVVHHGVGAEDWDETGFVPRG